MSLNCPQIKFSLQFDVGVIKVGYDAHREREFACRPHAVRFNSKSTNAINHTNSKVICDEKRRDVQGSNFHIFIIIQIVNSNTNLGRTRGRESEGNVRHMFVEWTSLDFCCWCLVPEVYKLPCCTNTNLIKFHSINCNGINDSIITQYPSNRSLFSALKFVQCTRRTCFIMFFPLFETTNPECPHHRSHQNRWQRQSLHLSYKTIINRLSALRVLRKRKRALTTRGCRDTSSSSHRIGMLRIDTCFFYNLHTTHSLSLPPLVPRDGKCKNRKQVNAHLMIEILCDYKIQRNVVNYRCFVIC